MVSAEIASVDDTPDAAVELAKAHRTSPYQDVAGYIEDTPNQASALTVNVGG